MRRLLGSRFLPLLATMVVFLALYGFGVACFPGLRSLYAFLNLFGDYAFLGVAAVGTTFVILSGGIDLSAGSMVAFTGMFVARAVAPAGEGWGWPPAVAFGAALALGLLFGAGMGTLIHLFELPPFLVTLAGMFFARGMAFVVGEESITIGHPFYRRVVNETLTLRLGAMAQVRFVATCFLCLLLLGILWAHLTRFGRNVYALGGSESSARLMGLPVGRTKIGVYALAGLCSALAGIVFTMDQGKGDPRAAVGLELNAIASAVIGGTLLSGGVGYIAGTLFGVLVYSLIKSLIDFQGNIDAAWTSVVIGGLLFVFILLQKVLDRAAASRRKPAG